MGPAPPHRARFLQGMPPLSPEKPALCAGCGGKIADRYYLLAVDKQWHLRCLKCCVNVLALESELTCFAADGQHFLCKEDCHRYSQPAPSPPRRGRACPSLSQGPLRLSPPREPPRAPSNCSVPTPARLREEGAPEEGTPGLERFADSPAQAAPGAPLGTVRGSVNVSASTEAKAGWVCVPFATYELSQAGALELAGGCRSSSSSCWLSGFREGRRENHLNDHEKYVNCCCQNAGHSVRRCPDRVGWNLPASLP